MRNQETVEFDCFDRKWYFLISVLSMLQDAYAIGTWGTQVDITELREFQQALLQAAQEKTAELIKANGELQQRDRLLSTVAQVTKDLLEAELVDRLVAQRFQAEQERAAELVKANDALKRSLNSLATDQSLDRFLGNGLIALATQFNSTTAKY
jgi:hypothetical protein